MNIDGKTEDEVRALFKEPKKSCKHCYGRGYVGMLNEKPMKCICSYSQQGKLALAQRNISGIIKQNEDKRYGRK